MYRLLTALIGLAVLGAVFAGIYYAPQNRSTTEREPAFNPAAGDVRSFGIQPSVPDSVINVKVVVFGQPVDVYIMDKEWAGALIDPARGELSLAQPFSFHMQHSATNVTGEWSTSIVSDGLTWHMLVIDNSDNFYDNDTVPAEGTAAHVEIVTRYVAEETRTLVFGYIAVVPSVLLVVVTLGRQVSRAARARRARAQEEGTPGRDAGPP